jgi:hypothetical protein
MLTLDLENPTTMIDHVEQSGGQAIRSGQMDADDCGAGKGQEVTERAGIFPSPFMLVI